MEATLGRMFSLIEAYGPYTHLDCVFETDNIRRVYRELSPEDQRTFNCDVSRIQWREYIQDIHIPGLKRHVLKMPLASQQTDVEDQCGKADTESVDWPV